MIDSAPTPHKIHTDKPSEMGEVWLVGAGPGDPELLTRKAYRLMQEADVVLYDRLVSEAIMALLPESIERIYVGKRRANHSMEQSDISELLAQQALGGKKVLRLKGGDPFIFGRGGEEIECLWMHNIPFQVVPGITAASGCASYAGIPLTHRDYSQSVRFITGHLKNGEVNLNWPELVPADQTLVFYMGLLGLPDIAKGLIKFGRDPETPLALVEKGTTSEQKIYTATLATAEALLSAKTIQAPTLIIVGGVVALREKLQWLSD